MEIFVGSALTRGQRRLRLALFGTWALAVALLATRHVFWRDEVRAFSIALQGDGLVAMLRGLQGEGHPALWYLLLRAAHAMAPVREVLPAVAFLVAAAAMLLLCLKSPFRASVIALILFGQFGLFEYSVTARNYGISMLLLFALAAAYPRFRDRGIALGALLFLLANTNVPSALLSAAFLGFWLVELIAEEGLRWTRKHSLFAVNAAVAALGALACFLEVFPTVHDAVVSERAGPIGLGDVLDALALPASAFPNLAPEILPHTTLLAVALAVVVAGSLLGLVRAPAALIPSIGVLFAFELFFRLVYPGSYRHQALLLVWFVAMYWLVGRGRGGRWPERWRIGERTGAAGAAGTALFALLLAMQLPNSFILLTRYVQGVPNSQARNLAALLKREGLDEATLVADPDVLLEPLPYYARNRIYLLREQRFGNVVRFTRSARMGLGLGDVLHDARALRARFRQPVVIVLHHDFDEQRPRTVSEGYLGTFSTTPDQVRDLRRSTRKLATLSPAISDEIYDVYLLPLEAAPSPP